MSFNLIKSGGGSDGALAITLAAKIVWSTRYAIINSGTSGTITKPSNSTIILDDFGGTTDAIVTKSSSSKPEIYSAKTSSGVVVATSFNTSGDWVLTGTPSAYPIAIVYRVKQSYENFDSTASDIWGVPTLVTNDASEVPYSNIGMSGIENAKEALDDHETRLAQVIQDETDTNTALATHEGSSTAHTANNITNSPIGNLSSSNVQDSLVELQTEIDTNSNNIKNFESTGIKTGGIISIGTGGAGVATTFTIAAGTGQIVDNASTPPNVTQISWAQKTDVAITNLATNAISYIALDSSGNVQQSTTDWTPDQMRNYIEIGLVSHPDLTTVSAVNQMQTSLFYPVNQVVDMAYSLGNFNILGNVFSANGANLKLNKSAGSLFAHGANYSSLTKNPNVITNASLTQPTFRPVNRSGASSPSTSDIDVTNYDNAGVTTSIPVNKFTIHRIFLFTSNFVALQRGQNLYNSLAEAKAAIQTEGYVINPGLANGLLRAYIVVKQGATSLQSASDAFILSAPKFGGSAGVGGLSVSTMQNAYDNSSTPEVLTDSTRGALSIKRGSAADTDTVLEVLNGAGSTTFSVTGAGVIAGTSIDADTNTITNIDNADIKALAGIAASKIGTGVINDTEFGYLNGVTSSIQTQIDAKETYFARTDLRVSSTTGYGSTATRIPVWGTTHFANVLSLTADAVNGDSITIPTTGEYEITFNPASPTVAMNVGWSVNASSLITNIQSLSYANGMRMSAFTVANRGQALTATHYLTAGDVVRPHTDGAVIPNSEFGWFSIRRIR